MKYVEEGLYLVVKTVWLGKRDNQSWNILYANNKKKKYGIMEMHVRSTLLLLISVCSFLNNQISEKSDLIIVILCFLSLFLFFVKNSFAKTTSGAVKRLYIWHGYYTPVLAFFGCIHIIGLWSVLFLIVFAVTLKR